MYAAAGAGVESGSTRLLQAGHGDAGDALELRAGVLLFDGLEVGRVVHDGTNLTSAGVEGRLAVQRVLLKERGLSRNKETRVSNELRSRDECLTHPGGHAESTAGEVDRRGSDH